MQDLNSIYRLSDPVLGCDFYCVGVAGLAASLPSRTQGLPFGAAPAAIL